MGACGTKTAPVKAAPPKPATDATKTRHLLDALYPEHVLPYALNDVGEDFVETYDRVSILFADIVGWTDLASSLDARTCSRVLSAWYHAVDARISASGCLKIETCGDSYMVASGVLNRHDPDALVQLGVAMILEARRMSRDLSCDFRVRVGIHTGPASAGLIRCTMPKFQLFGTTVNLAARMETSAPPGMVQLSCATHALQQTPYAFQARLWVPVKGATSKEPAPGYMHTYVLAPTVCKASSKALATVSRQKILVVEDSKTMQRLLHRLLVSHRFRVTFAESATAALRAVTETMFDIVLTDIHLPDEDGASMARRMLRVVKLPIVGLTGDFDASSHVVTESIKRKCLQAGMVDVLPKHMGSCHLVDTLRRALACTW